MPTFSMLCKWLSILSFLVIYNQAIQAQDHTLHLKSGAIKIQPNLDQFAASIPLPSELIQQHYYRLLHFDEVPDQTIKNQLNAAGITLLEYLPENTYIAAIDVRFDRKTIADFPVHAVLDIPLTAKINPRVFEQPLPAYNKNKKKVKLICRIQNDISINKAKEWLQLAGIEIIKAYNSTKILEISVEESSLNLLAQLPYLAYTDLAPEPGAPEGLGGRNLVRSNLLNHNGKAYDGTGIKGCVFDDGFAGPHVDFKNRTIQNTVVEGAGGGTHGDMVAGIFGGAGNINPDGIGIAPGVFLNIENYYTSGYTMSSAEWHKEDGVSIFNASYSNGCNAGYTIVTQTVDQNAVDNPSMINIYSAGNSGTSNCSYGAGSIWGTITGGHKMAKNCITTANLFADGTLVPSSSRGPASDGRIKPDIAAFGQGQLSLDPNNQYDPGGGTSAASPTIAGLTAQLYQAYQEINNEPAPAALIKATLLNTAVDFGRPGPDFEYGWGQAHGGRALDLLERKDHLKDQISQGQQNTHRVIIPDNVDEIRLMLYWADAPGSEAAQKALVNNLDLKVTDLDGNVNLPLVLDHTPNESNLIKNAVPGIDDLNNVEQVRLFKPAGGDYTITIDGTNIPEGPQEYYLLYYSIRDDLQITYPLAGDHLVPNKPSYIYWDAYQNTAPFRLDYSLDGGNSWEIIEDNIPPISRAYSWTPPVDVLTNQAKFRLFRIGQFAETETFSIAAQPDGLVFISACDDTGVTVSWNEVNGADQYIVWALGDTKMEPIDTTSSTVVDLDIDINQEQWISVSAYSDDGLNGRRALAIQYTPNNSSTCLLECGSAKDLGIQRIITPSPIQNGCATSDMNVVIQLQNLGKETISGGTVYFSIDNGTEFSEPFTGAIPPAQSVPFQFSAPATGLTPGVHRIQVRTENSEDQTTCNNARTLSFRWIPGPIEFPTKEHFENYEICLMSNVCGPNYCTFDQNTWYNATNRQEDDSDWTVHAAENSRFDISPSTDRTKNTADGQFLTFGTDTYCGNREARLLSPCIDLSSVQSPFFRMDYFGVNSDEGSIRIDIKDENGATLDESFIRFNNSNNDWQRHEIDLNAYKGQSIYLNITGLLTGDDEYSIAIDNLEFYDAQSAPGVDFVIDQSVICLGEPTTLTGVVAGSYSDLQWTITPAAGVNFVDGTTNKSLRPTLAFSQAGEYTVQLTASNSNGSDNHILQNSITVGEGLTLPHFSDFEELDRCDLRGICNVSCTIDNGWYNLTNNLDDDTDWRTISGSPFFGLSEPGIDHTTFQSTGQYLLLDSYLCEGKVAILNSGCIDFTNTIAPKLTFWAIKGGSAELYIDILNNGILQTEIQAFTDEERNDEWIERTVDLSAFAGQQVNIQIRGITGNSLNDRISLDDISIYDDRKAPEANIKINTVSCSNLPVYIEDRSIGNVSSWEWSFEPNTYTFTNGTKASDQNVFVQFAPGNYNAQLIASNADGSDTEVINQAIVVNEGYKDVFRENFSRTGTCERTETCAVYCDLEKGWINEANTGEDDTDWRITNQNIAREEAPLSDHTFATSSGDMLLLTLKSQCIDDLEGIIYSPCFDLTDAVDPVFSFWYYLGVPISRVRLETSIFANGVWEELQPQINSPENEWALSTIDLSPYVGQVVTIRFEGKLNSTYPNFIAIDDVNLFTRNTRADPDFEIDAGIACTVAPIKLENKTLGYADSLHWEITPATYTFVNGTDASSENPEVLFSTADNYTIRLYAFNTVGSATETKRIDIFEAYPLPYVMDFEDMALCDDFNQCRDLCNLSQGWQNIREGGTGRNDWMTNKGYTFFLETGPSSDHTLGTIKGTYIYAHSFYCNDDVETEVISACVDLNDAIRPELSFWYHMYGVDMGTLEVEILNQGNWEMITAISGNQGTEWLESKVDLTDYIGQVISLRFRSKRGGQYSDIALDDILIQEKPVSTNSLDQQVNSLRAFPNPTAGSFTLVWKGGQSEEVAVEIFDVRGRLLASRLASDFQVANSGTIRIEDLSLEDYEAGTYWIRVRGDREVGVISIVKQ